MEFPKRAPNQRTHQTIKHNNQMKNPIRSLALGIALFGAASAALAQSTVSHTANLTLTLNPSTANPIVGNFTFSKFNQSLGTLTAVDLILNSSSVAGSFSLDTNANEAAASVSNFTGAINTRSTAFGLASTNTTATSIPVSPSLPYNQGAFEDQTYSVVGTPSLIASAQTYSINFAPYLSNYQSSDGSGSTANFSARLNTVLTITSSGSPAQDWSLFTAPTSYTLRYTYTPSGPTAVPEPGQVAASLLLLGGIGAYYFVKRRRKSAPAAA
jgi:hypothetical protein